MAMDPKSLTAWDWHRILLGEAPALFLVEALVRTAVIFVLLVVILRMLGKRMAGEISILELSLVIIIGAIIASPMQQPDRGILHGAFVLVLLLAYYRGLTWLTSRDRSAEAASLGTMSILVRDGVLLLDVLDAEHISREQLFATLRNQKVRQLGQVRRVYLEATGDFSVYEAEPERPGLSIMPETDEAICRRFRKSEGSILVCHACGATASGESGACVQCGEGKWQQAVTWKE
jgi:uncharacterized membrane protein YcaP (DUF421 family)